MFAFLRNFTTVDAILLVHQLRGPHSLDHPRFASCIRTPGLRVDALLALATCLFCFALNLKF